MHNYSCSIPSFTQEGGKKDECVKWQFSLKGNAYERFSAKNILIVFSVNIDFIYTI